MYRKCNSHVLELNIAIDRLFNILEGIIPPTITLKTHTKRKLKPINKNSSLGEQIKYYRMKEDIKQVDLGLKLDFHRTTLHHLENKDMKLVNINLIKGIIEELNLYNKVKINDDYIEFLLNNPCEKLLTIRKKLSLTRQQFADMLGVNITSVRRWELGNHNISRTKYEQLKKYLN